MPFLVQPFVMKLQEVVDGGASNFKGGGEGDNAESEVTPGAGNTKSGLPSPPKNWAQCWADATEAGCAGLIPPNQMLKAGNAAQYAILLGCNSSTPKYQVLKASFVTQAVTILPGFLPVASPTTPPGGEPNFDSLDGIGMNSDSNLPWLNACGNLLANWYMKGMAYYLPNGPMLTWL
tara:strand:- start:176 stop:706 length:531 start_codon:yes stop_codon:yes gene_type:complete